MADSDAYKHNFVPDDEGLFCLFCGTQALRRRAFFCGRLHDKGYTPALNLQHDPKKRAQKSR